MLSVARDASAAQIISACHAWLEVYASADFAALSAMSYQPQHLREHWSATSLASVIPLNYSADSEQPPLRVRLGDLRLEDHVSIEAVAPDWVIHRHGVRALVEFNLPLEGWWSDLTVQFELYELSGSWAFHLADIHVL